jgi:hypothetical protein
LAFLKNSSWSLRWAMNSRVRVFTSGRHRRLIEGYRRTPSARTSEPTVCPASPPQRTPGESGWIYRDLRSNRPTNRGVKGEKQPKLARDPEIPEARQKNQHRKPER